MYSSMGYLNSSFELHLTSLHQFTVDGVSFILHGRIRVQGISQHVSQYVHCFIYISLEDHIWKFKTLKKFNV
jgi:hypothetical protein